jgi:hypothetical protein
VTAIDELESLLQKSGLVMPPIPQSLVASFEKRGDWWFSTRSDRLSPYDYRSFVVETPAADYVLVGHGGHGVSSYALGYFLAFRGLRILLQLPFGGVYSDAERDRARIRKAFFVLNHAWPELERRFSASHEPAMIAWSGLYDDGVLPLAAIEELAR